MTTGERVVVGVDLVSVSEVSDAIRHHGERYCRRIYTPHELASCSGSPAVVAEGLAARFAGKEAVIKVLRPEDHQPAWTSIEIRKERGGWCSVGLSGTARALAEQNGIGEISISLCHEAELALAVAVGHRRDERGPSK